MTSGMDEASDPTEGQWPQLRPTRFDEPHLRIERELCTGVLGHPDIQDELLAIGPEPPLEGQWRHSDDCSWHHGRTVRAQRVYMLSSTLRSVLSCSDIEHYATVIGSRRKTGLWPRGGPPLVLLGGPRAEIGRDGQGRRKTRGPDAATIRVAVDALGDAVKAMRAGLPEKLDKYERNALTRVLAFLDLDAEPRLGYRSAEASRDRAGAAAKKSGQRHRQRMAPIVAAERERLDAEVAAGRMVPVSEHTYVSAD
jgi:hypothetical protein